MFSVNRSAIRLNTSLGIYFQHQPYLNDFNAEQSTHIVSVATVHYEPMGIYPGKTASLDVFGK
ncbi:NLPA lipoprotein [human gut metagenome]|uniref:NLPA lipoprotein n=1 Tax=human gut metagenome TaxID=408170 RepID=K1TLZ6_9ZZZZ